MGIKQLALSIPLQLLCIFRLGLCQVGIAGQFQNLLQTNASFDFDAFLKDSTPPSSTDTKGTTSTIS